MIPSTVKDGDLKPDVTLAVAHSLTGKAMSTYLHQFLTGAQTTTDSATVQLLTPMVTAMEYEGYVNLKPPCNTSDLINKESPLCFKGVPYFEENLLNQWIDTSKMWNPFITVKNNDNFHNAAAVFPYHHPEIEHTCDINVSAPCEVTHISNSEHSYNVFDDYKLAKAAMSAYEIKAKIKSN